MRNAARLLLAHSEEKQRNGIKKKLEEWGFLVDATQAVEEALDLARQRTAGKVPIAVLVCMDTSKRSKAGFIRGLRKITPAPIIFMSSKKNPASVADALDAGAHDFIGLPFGTVEHLARIEAAIRNTALRRKTGAAYEANGLKIIFDTREIWVRGEPVRLTPIEFRLLTLLATNAGKVCTHEELIADVWGPYTTDNLVLRVNMANIRKKIEEDTAKPKIIQTETGIGYRIAPQQPAAGV